MANQPWADQKRIDRLLSAVGRGDAVAYRELYDLAAPHLYAIAIRITRGAGLAEEVVQDVFVAVWRHAIRFDPARGDGMAWLATIGRNRAIDLVTRERRLVPLDEEAVAALPDPATGALDRLVEIEGGRALRHCLDGLPGPTREAILIAFFDGATHEAVAKRLERPLGTVKSWIRRGLFMLKRCLDPDADPEADHD